jgi:hypothetical protein
MRSSAEALPSIRQRLLRVLLWPSLVLLLAGALIDFITGVSPVGIAYDHALIDAALAVSAHVRAGASGRLVVDLPSSTTGVLRTDPEDSIFFRVSAPDGRFIAGDYDLENSFVNTPAGGAVTARCGTEGPLAFLEALDTGVGIPEDEWSLVTERFFRGRNTRGDGSGLGLAIVSEIARLHAGRLAIGPGRDGRGTCVRVLFPAS